MNLNLHFRRKYEASFEFVSITVFQKLKSNQKRCFLIITKFPGRINDHIYDSRTVFQDILRKPIYVILVSLVTSVMPTMYKEVQDILRYDTD